MNPKLGYTAYVTVPPVWESYTPKKSTLFF
jgi:hypothetical protein